MTHFSEELRKIIESYKRKIHSSEYEFHSKHCSLKEHEEYIHITSDQAISAITELVEKTKCPNCNKNIKIE